MAINTSSVNSLGIQMVDVNGATWDLTQNQTMPGGIELGFPGSDGTLEAAAFVQALAEQYPFANTIRYAFSENDFDSNGQLLPKASSFLEAAAAVGFQIIFVYNDEFIHNFDKANISDGTDKNTSAILNALRAQFTDANGNLDVAGFEAAKIALIDQYATKAVQGWSELLSWLADHQEVQDAVYGYELINEPASYSEIEDFATRVDEYVNDIQDIISANPSLLSKNVIVDLMHYAGQVGLLAAEYNGQTGIERIQGILGDALIWASHLYPSEYNFDPNGDSTLQGAEKVAEFLSEYYEPLMDDGLLMTETNAPDGQAFTYWSADATHQEGGGSVNTNGAYYFMRASEWFSENGVGVSWWPAIEGGASGFGAIQTNNLRNVYVRSEHVNSIAWAANLMSIGENPVEHADAEVVHAAVNESGNPRDERYSGETVGFAFGFAGNDTIYGSDNVSGFYVSSDFLYGGSGHDLIYTGQGSDRAFGQEGNDIIMSVGDRGGESTYGHDNYLMGGSGADSLIGGAQRNHLEGGTGRDSFFVIEGAHTVITDFVSGPDGESITFTNVGADGYAILGGSNEITGSYRPFASFADLLAAAQIVISDHTRDIDTSNDHGVLKYDENGNPTLLVSDLQGLQHATLITLPNGGTLLLHGILPSQLSPENFGFQSPDGVIDGTSLNDTISSGFVDLDGDVLNDVAGANHVLDAGDGHDLVTWDATAGSTFRGGAGNDTMTGNSGTADVWGGAGDDVLRVINAAYRLYGESGNDNLNLGQRAAQGDGGVGDDILTGRMSKSASQIMTGGAGADTFAFEFGSTAGAGYRGTITDFERGVDHLVVMGQEIDMINMSNLPSGMSWTQTAAGLTLNFLDNETITLTGVTWDM